MRLDRAPESEKPNRVNWPKDDLHYPIESRQGTRPGISADTIRKVQSPDHFHHGPLLNVRPLGEPRDSARARV